MDKFKQILLKCGNCGHEKLANNTILEENGSCFPYGKCACGGFYTEAYQQVLDTQDLSKQVIK